MRPPGMMSQQQGMYREDGRPLHNVIEKGPDIKRLSDKDGKVLIIKINMTASLSKKTKYLYNYGEICHDSIEIIKL